MKFQFRKIGKLNFGLDIFAKQSLEIGVQKYLVSKRSAVGI